MIGIDSATGRYLHGNEHLRQSVTDILSTPVGSRVLLREYGSRLFSLLDNPQDDFTRVRIVRETVTALERWEPRLTLRRVEVTCGAPCQKSAQLVQYSRLREQHRAWIWLRLCDGDRKNQKYRCDNKDSAHRRAE